MTRHSKDEYVLPNGAHYYISQDKEPVVGSQLWNGFDYQQQHWVENGEPIHSTSCNHSLTNKAIDEMPASIQLYHHKTDGGAEYLTDAFILCENGHKEGIFQGAKYIVRIDGDITKDAELIIK